MEEITIRPAPGEPVWVVQSVSGRDSKRVFLAFRQAGTLQAGTLQAGTLQAGTLQAGTLQAGPPVNDPVHGKFPSIFTVNGILHRVECPKKKHISHVKVIATLNAEEQNALFSDYSNKTVASLVQKYDEYGELLQKRENSENLY